ncbi:DUF6173 family protein [Sagittula sp. SSi028]|uniref:DUF6173 family protein n=1 Tax=Sagittula sp. SSi028 TaxID=3400636 RepID=UPI003AF68AF9
MDDTISTSAEAFEASALPRRCDTHTEDAPAPQDLPESMTKTPVDQKSPARWAYERLALYIQNFEEQLDAEHEIAMGYAGSDAGVLRIEGIGYFDPDIVTFYGSDPSGAKMQLIQHVSQLSVVLRALPKQPEREAPRRIGFSLVSQIDPA